MCFTRYVPYWWTVCLRYGMRKEMPHATKSQLAARIFWLIGYNLVLHLVGVCLLVKGGADWRAPHPDDQPNQTGTGLDLARGIMVLVLWKMVIFNDRELAIAHMPTSRPTQ